MPIHRYKFINMDDNADTVIVSPPDSLDINLHYEDIKSKLAEKMAGEITLSDNPGDTFKKWRSVFEISQSDLAASLKVSPSVISDYESGRRKSPGIFIVSKIVEAILKIDSMQGGAKIRSYEGILRGGFNADAIYDIHEYLSPITIEEFTELVNGEAVYTPGSEYIKPLYGYTIVDSYKAILQLSHNEFQKLYGWSSDRAMIFTRVSTGKSPMVALRVTNLKPALMVLHGLSASQVDRMAAKIAEIEHVPLVATDMPLNEIIQSLQSYDTKN